MHLLVENVNSKKKNSFNLLIGNIFQIIFNILFYLFIMHNDGNILIWLPMYSNYLIREYSTTENVLNTSIISKSLNEEFIFQH